MRKLGVFNNVSLDGYFTDQNGDMSWARPKQEDPEWNQFVAGNASGGGLLLFGRVTYQMMEAFWPTPRAAQLMPELARAMNRHPKAVFSRTLKKADWGNTVLVDGDLLAETRRMKQEPGEGMMILGSGTIVSQLAREGLIDEYQVVTVPIAIGKGRTMFEGLPRPIPLRRTQTRAFQNGCVFTTYVPA